jgi:Na+(H+)/acetate symporter ActP
VTFVLFIGFFYTMPQMKGAGITMAQIMNWPYWLGVAIVGSVITFNVALGGMKGITFVQAFQYWAKMFAIAAPMFVLMSVYGWYHNNLGQNIAEPKGTPTLTEEKAFKYKGAEAYPANVITFSTAQDTTLTFAKDTVIHKISPTRNLLEGEAPIAPEQLLMPAETHFKAGQSATARVVTVTRNGQPVIENGKEVKTAAKIELRDPTEITYPVGTIVPNCPANSRWIQPFGALTGKFGYPLLYTYSLIIAIVCGTAGLPHILVRFYTNPDGRSAKRTTLWVMVLIGTFYLFPPMWGALGRNVMPALYANGLTDRVVIALPTVFSSALLGQILSGITSAGAFAAFMSTFSGLLVSMSGALSHDIYGNILRPGASPTSRLKAFKVSAVLIGAAAMGLGLLVETFDINMMVGWAFAIGAASYFPLLLMGSWWRGLTKYGAGVGMLSGGLFSLAAIVCAMMLDKGVLTVQLNPIVRTLLEQPAIWGVPLALLTMFIVSNLTRQHVPSDVDLKMLRLHAPEELGVSKDYIAH